MSYLNKKNYRTKLGNKFTKQSVEDKVRNIIYTGTYVYNKEGGKKKKKRLLLKDYREIVRENNHPAIISKEDFEKANKILDNRSNTRTNDRVHIYLLRGLIVCKHCGKTLVGGSNSGGAQKKIRHYYKCPEHKYGCSTKDINAEYIERSMANLVVNLISIIDVKKDLTSAINEEIKYQNGLLARQEKQLSRKKQELKRQTPLLADTTLSVVAKNAIKEVVEELVEDINNTKEIIRGINDEITDLKRIELEDTLDVESLLEMRHQARDLFKQIIDKITVCNDEITVKLKNK